jgi:hypothetical protein
MKRAVKSFLKEWVIPPKIYLCLLELYLGRSIKNSREDFTIISKNLFLKNKYKGKRCFVIGNGPSLNKVDLSRLNGEITIAMNYFNKNPILEMWQPTVYCAADPSECYNQRDIEQMTEVPTKIFPKEGFFFPLSTKKMWEKYDLFPKDKTYYLIMNKNFESWNITKEDIDLTQNIVGGQTTAIVGIILALYMGCNRVYLLGMDHDWLAYPKISLMPHFYQASENDIKANTTNSWKYKQNIEVVLTMFNQYEKIHEYAIKRNIEIINVTENSFLDEFPRAKFEDII